MVSAAIRAVGQYSKAEVLDAADQEESGINQLIEYYYIMGR
jgi:hypothetical protein